MVGDKPGICMEVCKAAFLNGGLMGRPSDESLHMPPQSCFCS